MKRQLIRISILQSSKIVTALYVLMGFLYTLAGIPMIIFGGEKLRVMGIIYLLGPIFAGVLGFIFFVIFAAIYNLLAKRLGGGLNSKLRTWTNRPETSSVDGGISCRFDIGRKANGNRTAFFNLPRTKR